MVSPIEPLLIDTDILVDYLRGYARAIDYLDNLMTPIFVSVITVAELYAGARGDSERSKLDTFVSAFGVLPVDHQVAIQGGIYRRDYGPGHGVGLADALIASTAEFDRAGGCSGPILSMQEL